MKTPSLLTLLCLLLSTVLLLGCSNAPAAKPLSVTGESATTRTIEHTFGTTDIPIAPQRVIALGEEGLLADLLDAGIKPLASNVNLPESLPLIEPSELEGVDVFASSSNVSIETLLTYDPDFIIGTVFFIDQLGYDRLSEIAPTVAIDGSNAFAMYTDMMTVLGRREEGEQTVAAFREEIKAEGARINAASRTVTVATIYPGPSLALWFENAPQPGAGMVAELGATVVPNGETRDGLNPSNGRAFISEERLDLFTGDPLILLQTTSVDGESEAVDTTFAKPLWQQVPAVQLGNVVTLDRLGYPGLRGQRALLAAVVAALE